MKFVTIMIAAAALHPVSAATPGGQTVVQWVKTTMSVVRAENIGTAEAGRLYALVTIAMYDAVNGLDSLRGPRRAHALVPPQPAQGNGDLEIAAAAAASEVLTLLFPSRRAQFQFDLDAAMRRGSSAAAGLAWGRYVGRRVVELRSADGTQAPLVIPPGTGPGIHRAAFDSRWRNMTPFGIVSKAAFASPGPPPLDSAAYAAAFDQVKALGTADDDAQRNEMARFWFAEAGTSRETGIWLHATIRLTVERKTLRSISDTARLFALVGMAIADAVIVSWEAKASYFSWRPMVAIREAALDGNPATVPDPTWTPRFGSPGGSPEYNSGTSTFAGAVSRVLELFYGASEFALCFESEGAVAGPRCWPSPLDAAREAGFSRILQGIHFRFSDEDGRRAGRAIGEEIGTTRLRPLP